MKLPDVANAPRLVKVGSVLYRVPAATLADFAELLALIEDRGGPGLPFASAPAQDALFGPDGLPLVMFLALRKCHPEITLADAILLAMTSEPDEVRALVAAYFRRRDDFQPVADPGDSKDLTEIAWGRQLEMTRQKTGLSYDQTLGLSLDQYENLVTGGKADQKWEGRPLTPAEAQAWYEDRMSRMGEG